LNGDLSNEFAEIFIAFKSDHCGTTKGARFFCDATVHSFH
jgi:hypothetical protein